MTTEVTGIRDTALLGAACAGGVVVSTHVPEVGLPLTAAAAAGLAYRGRLSASIVAALLGVAAVWLIVPIAVVFAAPTAAVVLLAVRFMPSRPVQATALVLTVVIAGSAMAAAAVSARLAGQTLAESFRTQSTAMTESLVRALGSAGSAWADQLEAVRSTLVMLWPALYVQNAIIAAVLVIAAISWAATRSGMRLTVPAMKDLDLSVHVLWLLVAGLVALAGAAVADLGDYEQTVRAVGLNVLFIARTLFFLQGVAVFSALFDVPKTGHGKMIALYIMLYLVDQVLLIVSLAGLLDFWANFRRLPRDGSGKSSVLEDSPGRHLE